MPLTLLLFFDSKMRTAQNGTECTLVGPAISTTFLNFDYKDQMAQQDDEQLFKAYSVKLDEVQQQPNEIRLGSAQWS